MQPSILCCPERESMQPCIALVKSRLKSTKPCPVSRAKVRRASRTEVVARRCSWLADSHRNSDRVVELCQSRWAVLGFQIESRPHRRGGGSRRQRGAVWSPDGQLLTQSVDDSPPRLPYERSSDDNSAGGKAVPSFGSPHLSSPLSANWNAPARLGFVVRSPQPLANRAERSCGR